MKQTKRKKKFLSWLLVLSMMVSSLTGITFMDTTAAAAEASIELGNASFNEDDSYTYPDAQIKDTSSTFRYLSISVDSGSFKVPAAQLGGNTGTGVEAGTGLSSGSGFEQLNEAKKYEAVNFSFDTTPVSVDKLNLFLQLLVFYPEDGNDGLQTVTVNATTLGSDDLTITINGKDYNLHYFSGHYYGYISDSYSSWKQAYTTAMSTDFCDVKGYLATLTSRAEDRFIYSTFGGPTKGWIGCTRVETTDGIYGTETPNWGELKTFPEDYSVADVDTPQDGFTWRWVSGPEAGQKFGFQNHYCGDRLTSYNEGGFVTNANTFSNWRNNSDTEPYNAKIEPNGGGPGGNTNQDEAYGYYGEDEYGRWNDHQDGNGKAFYIEFGGSEDDDKKIADALGQTIISITQSSKEDVPTSTPASTPSATPEATATATPKPSPTAKAITNKPIIKNQNFNKDSAGNPVKEAGAVLTADLSKIGPDAETKNHITAFQWYTKDDNGNWQLIPDATSKTYTLTDDTASREIQVKVTATGTLYTGSVISDPYNIAITGTPSIVAGTKDADGNPILQEGTELKADVSGIGPDENAQDSLIYQWYTVDDEGNATPIASATSPTYTLTADDLGKNFVVEVTGTDTYYGSADNGDAGYQVPAAQPDTTEKPKTPISGLPLIVNQTTDDNGNPVVSENTVLTAVVTATDNSNGVTPVGSHDTLTYQWYTQANDGTLTPIEGATSANYQLTTDTIGKKIVVTATGNGDYTGTVTSKPFTATRTNAGISVEPEPEVTPEPSTPEVSAAPSTPEETKDPYEGTRKLTITPTQENTIYAIMDEDGNIYSVGDLAALPAVDGNGNTLTPNVDDYPGYYRLPEAGGTIVFTVAKDKNYIIHEITLPATIDETSNSNLISATVPSDSIDTDYDAKGTEDDSDDTISIEVNPALPDYKYAVLKKENGVYVDVPIKKDSNGNYGYTDSEGTDIWTDGGENVINFTKLPADGTYRIVAIAADGSETIISTITPDQVIGGSSDIKVPKPAPTPISTVTPAPSPTLPATSSATGNNNGANYTPEEEDAAKKFINNYVTDPNGKIIISITDLTKDIIESGESTWNTLSDGTRAAVNAILEKNGSPYTYEQLLTMAKTYKIPHFKLKKVMKKGTKARLKFFKTKGAAVICTSTNPKVATVNKKGVIKAKKIGKSTLTVTVVKGKYTNRLVVKIVVRKKFKNAKELKKYKQTKKIKTPTILIAKKRLLKKSTKIKIYGLEKTSKVKFKSFNKKALPISKKGRYTAKKLGSSLMRANIKQNGKTYILYVYVTSFKKGKS